MALTLTGKLRNFHLYRALYDLKIINEYYRQIVVGSITLVSQLFLTLFLFFTYSVSVRLSLPLSFSDISVLWLSNEFSFVFSFFSRYEKLVCPEKRYTTRSGRRQRRIFAIRLDWHSSRSREVFLRIYRLRLHRNNGFGFCFRTILLHGRACRSFSSSYQVYFVVSDALGWNFRILHKKSILRGNGLYAGLLSVFSKKSRQVSERFWFLVDFKTWFATKRYFRSIL